MKHHPPGGDVLPLVEIVVPAHNEAHVLDAKVRELHAYLASHLPLPWKVTIADSGSTDDTWTVARALAADLPGVQALKVDRKGRGLALRTAWMASDAPLLAYMDVDLSTGLDALLPLLAPLVTGHSDLAIGSRLLPGSRVQRGPLRTVVSHAYNRIVRLAFRNGFRDAQCGFKAGTRAALHSLLPLASDDGWFLDTELLLLAEHRGMRIYEVPVTWVDDSDSRVVIWRTALEDLRGLARVRRTLRRQS